MLTFNRLKYLLHYDPITGIFTWLQYRGGTARVGSVAGTIGGRGYRYIFVDNRQYRDHRLAIFYMTGSWPLEQVDHVKGDRSDCRWEKIREASSSQNMANRKVGSNSTSGFKGVSFRKREGRWCARVQCGKKRHELGLFDTPELAHAAYVSAANEYFGAFARAA